MEDKLFSNPLFSSNDVWNLAKAFVKNIIDNTLYFATELETERNGFEEAILIVDLPVNLQVEEAFKDDSKEEDDEDAFQGEDFPKNNFNDEKNIFVYQSLQPERNANILNEIIFQRNEISFSLDNCGRKIKNGQRLSNEEKKKIIA